MPASVGQPRSRRAAAAASHPKRSGDNYIADQRSDRMIVPHPPNNSRPTSKLATSRPPSTAATHSKTVSKKESKTEKSRSKVRGKDSMSKMPNGQSTDSANEDTCREEDTRQHDEEVEPRPGGDTSEGGCRDSDPARRNSDKTDNNDAAGDRDTQQQNDSLLEILTRGDSDRLYSKGIDNSDQQITDCNGHQQDGTDDRQKGESDNDNNEKSVSGEEPESDRHDVEGGSGGKSGGDRDSDSGKGDKTATDNDNKREVEHKSQSDKYPITYYTFASPRQADKEQGTADNGPANNNQNEHHKKGKSDKERKRLLSSKNEKSKTESSKTNKSLKTDSSTQHESKNKDVHEKSKTESSKTNKSIRTDSSTQHESKNKDVPLVLVNDKDQQSVYSEPLKRKNRIRDKDKDEKQKKLEKKKQKEEEKKKKEEERKRKEEEEKKRKEEEEAKKRKKDRKDPVVKEVSKMVTHKLDIFLNREKRQLRFSTDGAFRTTHKMAHYDLAYKIAEQTRFDKSPTRADDKQTKKELISPCLVDNSRRVVTVTEAARLARYAQTVMNGVQVSHLASLHDYRPLTARPGVVTRRSADPAAGRCSADPARRPLTACSVDTGHVQNYTRHVGAALHTLTYINYYKREGLHSGNVSSCERFKRIKLKSESEPKESPRESYSGSDSSITHTPRFMPSSHLPPIEEHKKANLVKDESTNPQLHREHNVNRKPKKTTVLLIKHNAPDGGNRVTNNTNNESALPTKRTIVKAVIKTKNSGSRPTSRQNTSQAPSVVHMSAIKSKSG